MPRCYVAKDAIRLTLLWPASAAFVPISPLLTSQSSNYLEDKKLVLTHVVRMVSFAATWTKSVVPTPVAMDSAARLRRCLPRRARRQRPQLMVPSLQPHLRHTHSHNGDSVIG